MLRLAAAHKSPVTNVSKPAGKNQLSSAASCGFDTCAPSRPSRRRVRHWFVAARAPLARRRSSPTIACVWAPITIVGCKWCLRALRASASALMLRCLQCWALSSAACVHLPLRADVLQVTAADCRRSPLSLARAGSGCGSAGADRLCHQRPPSHRDDDAARCGRCCGHAREPERELWPPPPRLPLLGPLPDGRLWPLGARRERPQPSRLRALVRCARWHRLLLRL
jgi:hypothetical protein